MSTPPALRWPLPKPSFGVTGQPVACPECDARERLLIGLDLDDHSEDPSHMACPDGHRWLEPGMPRRIGAQLLADTLDADPSLYGWLDELRDVHGG
ncbi:hypothetical protein ABZ027_08320 [Streptomyces sp. NPDC006332]|uniref:hypothetical protein n=1 Tax=Streptomyces sp. NPDC006332 TaxID=3155456 RepID=UPI0033B7A6D0